MATDRAYMDFDWINSLISKGVFLVTRLKKRIKYRVAERQCRTVSDPAFGIGPRKTVTTETLQKALWRIPCETKWKPPTEEPSLSSNAEE